MTLRVSTATTKSAVAAVGNVNVSTAVNKAAVSAVGDLRVSTAVVKMAVRTYRIQRIVRIIPPVPLQMICSCNPVCCFTYGA